MSPESAEVKFPLLSRRLARAFVITAMLAFVAGCASNRVISDGPHANLMLKGYDPVAYFTVGKPVPGKVDIAVRHDGLDSRMRGIVRSVAAAPAQVRVGAAESPVGCGGEPCPVAACAAPVPPPPCRRPRCPRPTKLRCSTA